LRRNAKIWPGTATDLTDLERQYLHRRITETRHTIERLEDAPAMEAGQIPAASSGAALTHKNNWPD
jgi:hypothetical protein